MKRYLAMLTACLLMLSGVACAEAVFDAMVFETGAYTVGVDMPAGVYSLRIPEGGAGKMTITGENGAFERVHEAKGEARFTVYLPNRATVRVEGGTLQEVLLAVLELYDGVLRYTGDGKLLCMADIPDGGCSVRRAEGASEAWYAISTKEAERGLEEATRVELTDGEWQEVELEAWQYIELHNCELETKG